MRSLQFQVRGKAPADEEWTLAYLRENWGFERIVTRRRVHEGAALPGFIAAREGRPAGIVLYRIENNQCEIVLLESFAPKMGIGSALIGQVKERAGAEGCRRVWLITTNDNTAALRFYQLRGFQLVAVYPNAIAESRKLKPEIPSVGMDGIPIRDEIELELLLKT